MRDIADGFGDALVKTLPGGDIAVTMREGVP